MTFKRTVGAANGTGVWYAVKFLGTGGFDPVPAVIADTDMQQTKQPANNLILHWTLRFGMEDLRVMTGRSLPRERHCPPCRIDLQSASS
jgi:hypothetical protein